MAKSIIQLYPAGGAKLQFELSSYTVHRYVYVADKPVGFAWYLSDTHEFVYWECWTLGPNVLRAGKPIDLGANEPILVLYAKSLSALSRKIKRHLTGIVKTVNEAQRGLEWRV